MTKFYYSFSKAFVNGITALHMGGEIVGDQLFREKDVLEDDYSCPILEGTCLVEEDKIVDKYHYLTLTKNGLSSKVVMTGKEFIAGLVGVSA